MDQFSTERRDKKFINLEAEFKESAKEFEELRETISLLPRDKQEVVWKHIERDYLTGAFNRGKLERYGHDMKEIFGRNNVNNLSLLMIDIDDFKKYNDSFGHPAGDMVLRGVSEAIQLDLRAYDRLFRYGGEEFAVTLPGSTLEQGCNVAERIRKHIEFKPFYSRDITVSIGVANQSGMPLEIKTLIENADIAMYKAKRNGKNTIVKAQEILYNSSPYSLNEKRG